MHKFWDSPDMQENDIWKNWDIVTHKESIIALLNRYPKFVDYTWNVGQSCFGWTTVYLWEVDDKGVNRLKLGYTKQEDVEDRYSEHRYEGRDDFKLIQPIRQERIQAGGAKRFEAFIKDELQRRAITNAGSGMKMPGKGEIFDLCWQDLIVEIWDKNIEEYRKIVDLKSPT